jgi:hypothetical protein
LPPPVEVLVQLEGDRVQPARRGQDAGADPLGQALQDNVVVLAGVGDADQAEFGGRDQ